MFGGFGAPYTRGYDRVSQREDPVHDFYYRNCESGSLAVMEYFPFPIKTDSSLTLPFPPQSPLPSFRFFPHVVVGMIVDSYIFYITISIIGKSLLSSFPSSIPSILPYPHSYH